MAAFRSFLKKYPAILPVCLFAGISLLFYFLSPETIIGFVGVENAYLFMGIIAFFGGVTTFSGIPYHLILISLAAGGLNPFILGLIAGLSVMLGDSVSYYLGLWGQQLIPPGIQRWLNKLKRIYEKYPRLLLFVFFAYGSLVPMSNDVITIPMGILEYPYWRVMIPLGLGNIVFNVSLALAAVYAQEYLPFFG